LAGRLDLRCAVSDDAEALAKQYLGGTYVPIFNGIEIEPYAKAEPSPTDRPTILFLGRHEERKGLSVLLAALPSLPRDVRLWVAGPETERLQERVAGDPRVEWLGAIDEDEKRSRLRAADIYCAPSLRGESFGVVLLEAMAAGTAIVASDLAGYRRVARPDQDALLVPPGDAVALARALNTLLSDGDRAEALVASGEERVQRFSMDRLAERYVELYRGVVTRSPVHGT
jgi:phosphatidylinositol alpha-mannosyltransferase